MKHIKFNNHAKWNVQKVFVDNRVLDADRISSAMIHVQFSYIEQCNVWVFCQIWEDRFEHLSIQPLMSTVHFTVVASCWSVNGNSWWNILLHCHYYMALHLNRRLSWIKMNMMMIINVLIITVNKNLCGFDNTTSFSLI